VLASKLDLVLTVLPGRSGEDHLLPKINARDRAQAVSFAYQNRLVSPGHHPTGPEAGRNTDQGHAP
jgi:hypothetical protein